jgi:hypothetical protein
MNRLWASSEQVRLQSKCGVVLRLKTEFLDPLESCGSRQRRARASWRKVTAESRVSPIGAALFSVEVGPDVGPARTTHRAGKFVF